MNRVLVYSSLLKSSYSTNRDVIHPNHILNHLFKKLISSVSLALGSSCFSFYDMKDVIVEKKSDSYPYKSINLFLGREYDEDFKDLKKFMHHFVIIKMEN